MKKITLFAVLAATAALYASETTVQGDSEIGMMAITAAAGQKNVLVPVKYNELADDGALSVSNIVKTANLSNGDELYVYNGSNYEAWKLTDGKWEPYQNVSIQGGTTTTAEGSPSDSRTMAAGTALWLVRADATAAVTFYVYGEYVTSFTAPVTAGAHNLLANPRDASVTITADSIVGTPANGDMIEFVSSSGTTVTTASYSSKKATWSVKVLDKTTGKSTRTTGLSYAVGANLGIWYVAAADSGVTAINW